MAVSNSVDHFVDQLIKRMNNLARTYTYKIAKFETDLAFSHSAVQPINLDIDALEKLSAEIAKLNLKANPLKKSAVFAKFVAKGTFIIWPIIILIILKILKIKESEYEFYKAAKERFPFQ